MKPGTDHFLIQTGILGQYSNFSKTLTKGLDCLFWWQTIYHQLWKTIGGIGGKSQEAIVIFWVLKTNFMVLKCTRTINILSLLYTQCWWELQNGFLLILWRKITLFATYFKIINSNINMGSVLGLSFQNSTLTLTLTSLCN